MATMFDRSAYASGHFLFCLDVPGLPSSYVRSLTGGNAESSVISEALGNEFAPIKHHGPTKIAPISFDLGMSMALPTLDWIRRSWRGNYDRHSGVIIHADQDLKARQELEFEGALLTEVRFPALDGASREPAYLGITMQPEWTRPIPGLGVSVRSRANHRQRDWSASSFRLFIDGIDGCRFVNKIDGFAVKQHVKALPKPDDLRCEYEPVALEWPNMTFYLAEAYADSFYLWHRNSVLKGRTATRAEKTGALEYLTPNRSEILFTVVFKHIGIHNLTIEKSEGNADSIKRVKVETHIQDLELIPGPGMF
jgi:hypothetical protein